MSRKGVSFNSGASFSGEVAQSQKKPQENDDLAKAGGVPGGVKKRKWLHPVQAMEEGRVSYTCKLLGSMPVSMASKDQGAAIVKECVKTLKAEALQKRERGETIPEISFNVSDKALRIQDSKSKNILSLHSLHYISYCIDEKSEGNKIFAYIARESGSKAQICYIIECDNLAREMAATLGQAFDLAYKKYLETKRTTPEKVEIERFKSKVRTGDKEKEELEKKVALLEQERLQKNAETELLKQQVIDLQVRKINDGIQAAEAPLDFSVPRPETKELDAIIKALETQIADLDPLEGSD